MHQSLFMSALSAHPDRSLSVCWEQHCKLLPGVAGISASTVAKWTIDEVRICPHFAFSPHPGGRTPERPSSGRAGRYPSHLLLVPPLLAAQWGLTDRLFNRPILVDGRRLCC